MRRGLMSWIMAGLLLAAPACSDDDSGGKGDSWQQQPDGGQTQQDGGQQQQDSGSSGASCSVTVTTEETSGGIVDTVVGKGSVTCDAAHTLGLEVCLQWDSSGSFEDVICQSSTESGVKTLEVKAESSCGLSATKYRTVATLTVDGAAQVPETSQEITACGP